MEIRTNTPLIMSARLPLPPGINHSYKIVSYRQSSTHRFAASDALAQFKRDASLLLPTTASIDWQRLNELPLYQPLAVEIIFYFTTLWKRDIDGGIKSVLDVLFAHIGLNDNLVTRLVVEKRVDRDDPHCDCTVAIGKCE